MSLVGGQSRRLVLSRACSTTTPQGIALGLRQLVYDISISLYLIYLINSLVRYYLGLVGGVVRVVRVVCWQRQAESTTTPSHCQVAYDTSSFLCLISCINFLVRGCLRLISSSFIGRSRVVHQASLVVESTQQGNRFCSFIVSV